MLENLSIFSKYREHFQTFLCKGISDSKGFCCRTRLLCALLSCLSCHCQSCLWESKRGQSCPLSPQTHTHICILISPGAIVISANVFNGPHNFRILISSTLSSQQYCSTQHKLLIYYRPFQGNREIIQLDKDVNSKKGDGDSYIVRGKSLFPAFQMKTGGMMPQLDMKIPLITQWI